MNRYWMIRRLRWPVMLVLTGVLALLNQMGIARFGHTWPLYLVFWGVLMLAERAAINEADLTGYPADPMVGPYGGPVAPAGGTGVVPVQTTGTSIVPVHGDEIVRRDGNGGTHEGGGL